MRPKFLPNLVLVANPDRSGLVQSVLQVFLIRNTSCSFSRPVPLFFHPVETFIYIYSSFSLPGFAHLLLFTNCNNSGTVFLTRV